MDRRKKSEGGHTLNCHTLQCIVKHFRSFLFKIYVYSATHSGALCHCIFHFSDNRNGAFCSPAGFQENFSQRNCHNSKLKYIFGWVDFDKQNKWEFWKYILIINYTFINDKKWGLFLAQQAFNKFSHKETTMIQSWTIFGGW